MERLRCRVQKGGCNPLRGASGLERAKPRPDRGGEKPAFIVKSCCDQI